MTDIRIGFNKNAVKRMIWYEEKVYVMFNDSLEIFIYSKDNPSDYDYFSCNWYKEEDKITLSREFYSWKSSYPDDMVLIKSKKMIVILWQDYLAKIKLPSKEISYDRNINWLNNPSITSSDQMLVAVKRGQPERCYVEIYEPSEQSFSSTTKESILMLSNVSVESNVVQSSKGNFIFLCIVNDEYLITELSADGKNIIRSVKPSHLSVVFRPVYFLNARNIMELMHQCLLINEHDEIFILDRLGGKILLLNPQWTELSTLISSIYQPYTLQYLQEEHQLIVGLTYGQIRFYNLK